MQLVQTGVGVGRRYAISLKRGWDGEEICN